MLQKEDYEGGVEGKYVYCSDCQWVKRMEPLGESRHWARERVVTITEIANIWPVACETEELHQEIYAKLKEDGYGV
jgi:hypothetical protein